MPPSGTAWYDRAFGPWYPRLYPHRSQAEADLAVATLAPELPRGPLLDVASGAGRHLRALAARGRDAVGIDRSPSLLSLAREGDPAARLVRGDMRQLPFADAGFAGVLTLFTSFGYFPTREAHRALLGEYRRVTRAGGVLVLDYLDAERTTRDLVPESRRSVDGHDVHERRRIETRDGDRVVIKEVSVSREGNEVERYREEVALYESTVVESMLRDAGWRRRRVLGDYRGTPWTTGSERFLWIGETT